MRLRWSWQNAIIAGEDVYLSLYSKRCDSIIILRLPPPNLPRTLKATKAALSWFLKVRQSACVKSARTGCMRSIKKSFYKLSTHNFSGRSPWLISVCDPFNADTKGSINIVKYGRREESRTGTVKRQTQFE